MNMADFALHWVMKLNLRIFFYFRSTHKPSIMPNHQGLHKKKNNHAFEILAQYAGHC